MSFSLILLDGAVNDDILANRIQISVVIIYYCSVFSSSKPVSVIVVHEFFNCSQRFFIVASDSHQSFVPRLITRAFLTMKTPIFDLNQSLFGRST